LERLDAISEFPEIYPIRDRQPYAGFRYFFTSGWCVSYTTAQDTLIMLAVAHDLRVRLQHLSK